MSNNSLWLTLGVCIFIAFLGGAIALNGFILGTVISAGVAIIIFKLPVSTQTFIGQHGLILDMGISLLTFFLLGMNVIAIIAAAYVCLYMSALLKFLQSRYSIRE